MIAKGAEFGGRLDGWQHGIESIAHDKKIIVGRFVISLCLVHPSFSPSGSSFRDASVTSAYVGLAAHPQPTPHARCHLPIREGPEVER